MDFDDDSAIDPTAGMANLFDVAMVFAVALMVALVTFLQLPALLQQKDYTVITNPGQPDMEILVKEGEEIRHYEATEQTGFGQGELLGQAYRLPDGRVVYVPAENAGTMDAMSEGTHPGRASGDERPVPAASRLFFVGRRVHPLSRRDHRSDPASDRRPIQA